MMRRLTSMVMLASAFLGSPAVAAVLCQNSKGAVFVRETCKKRETTLDLAALGLRGPAGAKGADGADGAAGAPGTAGAAGSAVAYAHINADGTVDEANSKNVTSANVSKQATSAYCFHALTFTFKNAIAVIDYAGTTNGREFVEVALGNPFADCSGQPGTQLEASTSSSSNFAPLPFFIIFN